MADAVAALNAEIEKDKGLFVASRMRLAMLLGPAMPTPGAEDIFIAHALEVGIDDTLRRSMKDPAYFEIGHPVDKGLATKLAEHLKEADALNQRIIENVAHRENILMKKDPNHKPTYFVMGREFTIDPKNQTITYTDNGEVCAYVQDEPKPRTPSGPSKGMSR